MIDPTNTLGTKLHRDAQQVQELKLLVVRLSEALKRASSALDSTASMRDILGQHEAAATTRAAIHQFDLLILEADRV